MTKKKGGGERHIAKDPAGSRQEARVCGCVTGTFVGGRKGGSVFGGRQRWWKSV